MTEPEYPSAPPGHWLDDRLDEWSLGEIRAAFAQIVDKLKPDDIQNIFQQTKPYSTDRRFYDT